MPDSTLSQAIQEAYASAPSADIIYHTLEINHPDFTVPIRVVRDSTDLDATLEATAPTDPSTEVTFTGYSFDVVPPDVQSEGMPTCVIEIDNVSREILAQIEATMGSTDMITVIYRQFLASNLAAPENDPPLTLTVLSISADVFRIRATCGFGDLVNKRFPSVNYTAMAFPGLVAT
ncbi:MAG: DUF1833 domain-containing protein [Burkholderiaceae bacterium]|jgi:hypothetical protein|nr:DUF1833 domain-containing protein [Burkholderiaceae bacterium]